MGGGHHHNAAAMPRDDQDVQLLKDEKIELAYRDKCAHLLVPLNRCRVQTLYNPLYCNKQRHLYEECEYIAYQQRVQRKQQANAAAAAAST